MAFNYFSDEVILNSNISFQRELQNILSIIIRERSPGTITKEILTRTVELSKGSLGIVILNNEDGSHKFNYFDPSGNINNTDELEHGLKSSYPFLSKWFSLHRNSFIIGPATNEIGHNLSGVSKSDNVVFSPCFFESKLLALLIIAKDSEFTPLEISSIEQFAVILSFSISNLRTRELNTALESKLQQSQKLETIGKLSSGMAHDFSNLLSSIFGSLNLLKKKVPQNEDILRLLDNIENCSVRARDLTKGLLSYGKPTSKRKEIVKPNKLLSEMSKVITQTFPNSLHFIPEIKNDLYEVLGNPTEIYQVLLNLCVNAKEAMGKDGTLCLFAENLSISEIDLINYPMLSEGNYVHFSVRDSGSGIAEEHLQKIFEPYFSTKEKETGSGLGLYVSYGIIKAHNGIIEVSSVINQGTTFDVYLPAFESKKSDQPVRNEKIIMLVDDEVMLRDLLAELLESNSYNVIKVSSGTEALQILTEELKVDLIIIDFNMPGMNGLECIEKVRELKLNIPVVLSTGSYNLENKVDINSLGISHILAKPYEFETMLEIIKKLL